MAGTFGRRSLTRREFTTASLTAVFAGVAVTMTACGGGGSASPVTGPSANPAPAPTQVGDKTGTISSNHGHVASVTSVQLQAGGAVKLDIEGSAGHNHTVELTADQVILVAAGTRVTKNSSVVVITSDDGYGASEDRHEHVVTFN